MLCLQLQFYISVELQQDFKKWNCNCIYNIFKSCRFCVKIETVIVMRCWCSFIVLIQSLQHKRYWPTWWVSLFHTLCFQYLRSKHQDLHIFTTQKIIIGTHDFPFKARSGNHTLICHSTYSFSWLVEFCSRYVWCP